MNFFITRFERFVSLQPTCVTAAVLVLLSSAHPSAAAQGQARLKSEVRLPAKAVASAAQAEVTGKNSLPDLGADDQSKPSISFLGDGLKLTHQNRMTIWEVGGEVSSLHGPLARAGVAARIGDDEAVRLSFAAGPRQTEALAVYGLGIDNSQMLRLGLHHLRQQKSFGFESGTEKVWVQQTTGSATWRMYNLGGIAEYVDISGWYSDAPSLDLPDRDFSVDTPLTFSLYRDPRRISGRTQMGFESKLNLRLSREDSLSLSAGMQQDREKTLISLPAMIRATGSARWTHELGHGSKFAVGLRTSNVSKMGDMQWVQTLNNGSSFALQLSRNIGANGIGNDSRLEIKYSMPLEPVARSRSHQATELVASQPFGQRVFDAVREKLDFLPTVVAVRVDTTAPKQLLVQINKQALPAGATVLPNGDVSFAFGANLGTFTSAVNTTTGATLPASLFIISGASLVIKIAQLEPFLAGSSAGSPHTLTLTTSNNVITVRAFQGSVHIVSISVAPGGAPSLTLYPYETVFGDICSSAEPTPGCTFSRSAGSRISVSADPHYDRNGFGSDDLWSVKFDALGNAKVYNDLGTFQYNSDISNFAGFIGGNTIGVGTTGFFWENVSNGTYWLGKNGVLYNAKTIDPNFGKAIN